MLNKILNLFQKQQPSQADEEFLNESTDIYELEHRMKQLQQSQSNNWSTPLTGNQYN